MSVDTARLRGLHGRVTPVRDDWTLRDKKGEERYELIGAPCGFPVATFGDPADALFDLECRKHLPALLDEIERLRDALKPFATAADSMFDVGNGGFPVDSEASIYTGYDGAGNFVDLKVGHFRNASLALNPPKENEDG